MKVYHLRLREFVPMDPSFFDKIYLKRYPQLKIKIAKTIDYILQQNEITIKSGWSDIEKTATELKKNLSKKYQDFLANWSYSPDFMEAAFQNYFQHKQE